MLRNFFRKRKRQEPKVELEEVNFVEIESWLENKVKKFAEKEKKVFLLIQEKITIFTSDINEKTKILEAIDIKSKKVEERAKTIVKQSLDKYLNFIKIFTKELTDIDKQNLNHFIKGANQIFSDFDKRSYIFYQRTNYLIGDELLAVKQEINNLSIYFTDLFNENKKITDSLNLISSIKSKLTQLNETSQILDEINSEIESLDKITTKNKERKETLSHKIEKIKITKDYFENIEREEEIKQMEKQLLDNISKLKSLIDFKKLTNAFHSDENKMKTIRNYRENFHKSFDENRGDDILNLISKAELNNSAISNEIKQINERRKKIYENKKLIEKDEVKELLEEIEKIKSELEYIAIEKVKEGKKKEKIEENKEEMWESITPDITELGGTISR